ncbi:MAG: hypothetical protein AB7I42_08730 [Bradyrhizobium sp.]|uniref:hypothetical protein n=1 Tax=Bradyrhizobium sp. TaxID=376 RepID=UPI002A2D8A79|nr:hypothetical protein [Bradyrhizobium sp.]
MNRILLAVLVLFAMAYAFALAILAIGTFGLFGQERDPLSGVFLMPLGLPWNLMLTFFPDALGPWLALTTPAINLALIYVIGRLLVRSR